MKNTYELKVGQSADVYEALTDGGYTKGLIIIGSWSIDTGESMLGVKFIGNKRHFDVSELNSWLMAKKEVKKVGRLTITKLK